MRWSNSQPQNSWQPRKSSVHENFETILHSRETPFSETTLEWAFEDTVFFFLPDFLNYISVTNPKATIHVPVHLNGTIAP